ncbi:hypothetical protein DICPUDRAFT_34641, partial [Dictyostelium purpureum]
IPSTTKYLDLIINKPISLNFIPSSVEYLTLSSYNHPTFPNDIPPTVKCLSMPLFNHPIPVDSIPNTLEALLLDSHNHPIIENSIPESIKVLYLYSNTHDFEESSIPDSVEALILGDDLSYLKEQIFIPSTTKYLNLIIDQPISLHPIPSSVKCISLSSYNHPTFPNGIPPTVKCLSMPHFNHPIPVDSIPHTLEALYLDSHNHPIIENSIPKSIKVLSLESNTHDFEESSIPDSVEALFLGDNFNLEENGDKIPSKNISKFSKYYFSLLYRLIGLEEQCEQIIKFYGYGFGVDQNNNDNGLLYIYMEYLEGYKSIDKVLGKYGDIGLPDFIILHFLSECHKGLDFLHRNNIIHRDFKCGNIIFNSFNVKIIDFGISKYTDYKASKTRGTITHMSPETKNGKVTFGSDFWSLGCTAIEMGGGDLALDENNVPKIPKHFSKRLKLVTRLHLIKDPFYRGIVYFNNYSNMTKKLMEGISDQIKSGISTIIDLSNPEKQTSIPSTIKYLGLIIDEPISFHFIPSSVEYLTLLSYNHPTFPNGIPHTVKCLSMPLFNHPIPVDSVPCTLEGLLLDSHNHPIIENSIPKSIKSLSLGDNFNLLKYGGSIPSSIKVFRCGYNFKSPLKRNNHITKNIQILFLPNYNQPIVEDSIPSSVFFLELGSKFTHFESLKNLPKSIIFLHIGIEDNRDKVKIKKNVPLEEVELEPNVNERVDFGMHSLTMGCDNLPKHIDSEWLIDQSNPLGKGSFSEGVYKAKKLDGKINDKQLPNNGDCVIKIIDTKKFEKIAKRELEIIDILIGLETQCEEIIKFYGYGFGVDQNNNDNGLLYIYMEYLEGYESMDKELKKIGNQRFPEHLILNIVNQCEHGLNFLHKNKIIHRDIKCQNILVNLDFKIKIIDFGISKFTEYKASTFAGTPTHMSPEARNGKTIFKQTPIPSTIRYLDLIIDKPISLHFIPSSVEYLTLSSYNHPTFPNGIPSTIKILSMPLFNHPIPVDAIPQSVEALWLGDGFNLLNHGDKIPSSIKVLMSNYNFQSPLKRNNHIPKNVQILILLNYNQPIIKESIPSGLIILRLGKKFTHFESLQNLPKSILILHIGIEDIKDKDKILQNAPKNIFCFFINGESTNK